MLQQREPVTAGSETPLATFVCNCGGQLCSSHDDRTVAVISITAVSYRIVNGSRFFASRLRLQVTGKFSIHDFLREQAFHILLI